MTGLLNDAEVIERIFGHMDAGTTDLGDRVWREPVENYRSEDRFQRELALLRRVPVPFCPAAALPDAGSFVARTAAATPLLAVRGDDGVIRVFRNICRHRGMAVAEGTGCARAFVCPYHSWTYGLDGRLKHVTGDEGFPDLDPETHGLVPVVAEERSGLVFVTQDDPVSEGALEGLPELLTPDQEVFDSREFADEANWKLIAETSMEGYHIKALHNRTFYPYGFDNLNVVETYGANSRVIFPFRRIEKLRDIPPDERRIRGMVTDVHQLFPNTHLSHLSNHTMMTILEPETPTRTRYVIYTLSAPGSERGAQDRADKKQDADFVKDTGLMEDRYAACTIQAGLAGEANTHFTFGRYEKAIVHFHAKLDALLAEVP